MSLPLTCAGSEFSSTSDDWQPLLRLSRLALKISTIFHVFTRGYKWFSQTVQHIQPGNINNIFKNKFSKLLCVVSGNRGKMGKKKVKCLKEIPVAAVTSYHKLRFKTTQMCYLTVM